MWVAGFTIVATKHGQNKKPDKYNIWAWIGAKIIMGLILYYGGFWDALNV